MNWWGRNRSEVDERINEEFSFHIEQRAADLEREGLSREEAVRKARKEFGPVDRYKEAARGVWFVRAWNDFKADVRFGLRMLGKSPAFTVAAILTLTLAIGVNSAVFSAVYGILYRPLPFFEADRIALIYLHFSPQNNPRGTMSLADFVDVRDSTKSFEQVAVFSGGRADLRGGNAEAEQVASASVSADFFSVLGLSPLRGRTFRAGEDSGSSPNLAIISESLWERRFHNDEGVIGSVIEVNGRPHTVIGVVKSSYGVPRTNAEIWSNLHINPTRRGPFFFRGLGRLRPGVTMEQAQAEMNALGKRIETASPTGYKNLQIPIERLREGLTFAVRPALLMMFGAVLIVMAIATVNIANLLLARASVRQQEIAIRTSLGASRARLAQQMLTESIVLSLLGAMGGLVLAYWLIHLFKTADLNIPLTYGVTLDWRVVAFCVTLSVITAVVFGSVPAISASKPRFTTLRSVSASSLEGRRGHSVLVTAELALCLVLLVGAGLLLRSFMRLQEVSTGATAPERSVLTLQVSPNIAPSQDQDATLRATMRFYQTAVERVSQLPQVRMAAVSDSLPPHLSAEDDTFAIAGIPWTDKDFPSTACPRVSPGYFSALGVPLLRGRLFNERDVENSAPVVIISRSLAQRYFGEQDPIGRRLKQSGPNLGSPYMEIVGVVDDVKYWGLNSDVNNAYYTPFTQNPTDAMYLVVRTDGNAAAAALDVQRAVREIDKEAVIRRVLTLGDLVDESTVQPRLRATLLASFAALALVLGAIGTYGVIAYSVTQRYREFGVRLALGAPRANIFSLVLREGIKLTTIGIVIGLIMSFAVTRTLSSFLFGVSANDIGAVAGAAILLVSVALAATLPPAARAVRIDPMEAIRCE